jgi:hypothetical protein
LNPRDSYTFPFEKNRYRKSVAVKTQVLIEEH